MSDREQIIELTKVCFHLLDALKNKLGADGSIQHATEKLAAIHAAQVENDR